MSEFLDMGGYAFYVWSSWGMTLIVITWNIVSPIVRRREILQKLERDARRSSRA